MDKAQYLSATVDNGGNGLYPLSIQTLNFIQEQINLLQSLSKIGGKRYILQQSSATEQGIVVVDGEVLPLRGTPATAIEVVTQREDVVADGTTYREARLRRVAQYKSGYRANVPNLYPAAGFVLIDTNDALSKKFQNYTALATEIAKRLEVMTTSTLTSTQLDAQKDNIRLQCKTGCIKLNGATEYTIVVYNSGNNAITQEQIQPDATRYIRQWDPVAKKWGAWYTPTTKESLHLEVKVTSANKVYVRHGVLPDGVQLVLLRKKKRSGKRRSGGSNTTNPKFRGKSVHRQSKNQYCHFKGVVLSKGEPGKWYVPKCVSVGKGGSWNSLIGKELPTICAEFIQVKGSVLRARNTRFKASDRATIDGTKASLYVKMGLQLAVTNNRSKSSGGEMVPMKYRVWWDHLRNRQTGTVTKTRRRWGFSVE